MYLLLYWFESKYNSYCQFCPDLIYKKTLRPFDSRLVGPKTQVGSGFDCSSNSHEQKDTICIYNHTRTCCKYKYPTFELFQQLINQGLPRPINFRKLPPSDVSVFELVPSILIRNESNLIVLQAPSSLTGSHSGQASQNYPKPWTSWGYRPSYEGLILGSFLDVFEAIFKFIQF